MRLRRYKKHVNPTYYFKGLETILRHFIFSTPFISFYYFILFLLLFPHDFFFFLTSLAIFSGLHEFRHLSRLIDSISIFAGYIELILPSFQVLDCHILTYILAIFAGASINIESFLRAALVSQTITIFSGHSENNNKKKIKLTQILQHSDENRAELYAQLSHS